MSNHTGYKDTLCKIVLIVLLIIFFFEAITFKRVFSDVDIITKYIPNRIYVYQKLKEGELPLWTNELGCGHPLIAEGEVAFFYPFNLLFLFLPWYIAINSFIILHYFLAGWFMYTYVRYMNLRRTSAFLSAIIFTFSGFLISHFRHINMLATVIWLPLIFYYIEKIFKEKKVIYFSIISVLLTIQFFAFSPQLFFYNLLIIIFYFLFKVFIVHKENQLRYVGLFIIFLLLTLFLISIQLLPSIELVEHSVRASGIISDNIIRDSFPPTCITSLFLPTHQLKIKSWELCGYVSIIPLILTFVALFKRKIHSNIYFFFIIALVSVFLSFGSYNIFSESILSLPVFNLFAAPARFLFIFIFCISILAGIGLNYVRIKETLKFGIIMIILLDLYFVNVNRNIATSPIEEFYKLSPTTLNFLRNDKSKSIYRIWTTGNYKELTPNVNLLYKIESVNIYTPLMINRFWKLVNLIYERQNMKILDLLNVKYVFDEEGRVYINKNFLPRVFIVHKTKIAKDEKEALEIVNSAEFKPEEEVVLEKKQAPLILKNKKQKIDNLITIVKYSSNEIIINAELGKAGYLVLLDLYYPGWKCYVNSKKTKIYIANYALRAVYLNKGKHVVRFHYEPLSFKIGTFLSLFGIIITTVIFVAFIRKKL